MPVEFYEEDNLSAVVGRAYTFASRPRSKLVRFAMKLGFKTERGANIFLTCLACAGLFFASGLFLYNNVPKKGVVTSLKDIPLSVQQSMTPEELNYFKTYGGQ